MAPRDIYSPVPTVRPVGPREPTEQVHIAFPEVHLSDAVGQAMAKVGEQGYGAVSRAMHLGAAAYDSLGNALEKSGNQLWERALGLQDLQNETAVTKANLVYEKNNSDKRLEFEQHLGAAATPEVMKAHIDERAADREKIRDTLANDAQRRMFDRESTHNLGREVMHAATHTSQEFKKSAIQTADARMNQYVDDYSKAADPAEAERIYNHAQAVHSDTVAPLKGYTAEVRDNEWKQISEKMYQGKINDVKDSDPATAMKMLEAARDQGRIGAAAYNQLHNGIEETLRDQQTRNGADRIAQKLDLTEATDQERHEAADKMAAETNPNDSKLPGTMRARVDADAAKAQQSQARQQSLAFDNLEGNVHGFNHPDGKLPTTKEELLLTDADRQNWSLLKDAQKNRILKMMESNAKEDFRPTRETDMRFLELKEKFNNQDPRVQEEALAHHYEDEKIPRAQRLALANMVIQAKKQGLKRDPSVTITRRLGESKNIIPPSLRGANPAAYRLDGAISEALEAKRMEKKGVPITDPEREQILKSLMVSEGFWAGKIYQQIRDVPPAEERQLRDRYPGATDEQIHHYWAGLMVQKGYKLLKEESEKKAKALPPSKTPAAAPAPRPVAVPISQ